MDTSGRASSRPPGVVLAIVLLLLCGVLTPASAVEAAANPAAAEGRWRPPVAAQELRPFAAPPTPWSRGHRGADLDTPPTGQVRSPADGVVSFSGKVVNRRVLSINHGNGYISSFEPVESDLTVGDAVTEGQVVAELSTYNDGTHHCDSPCLHWGVRHHGEYINPMLLLGPVEPSVLLPLDERSGA